MENAANTAVGAADPALEGMAARPGAPSADRLFLLIGACSGVVGALRTFVTPEAQWALAVRRSRQRAGFRRHTSNEGGIR